jgi:hypothetical protein
MIEDADRTRIRDIVFIEIGRYFFGPDIGKPQMTRLEVCDSIADKVIKLLDEKNETPQDNIHNG